MPKIEKICIYLSSSIISCLNCLGRIIGTLLNEFKVNIYQNDEVTKNYYQKLPTIMQNIKVDR